jgi:hypothetical protein
MRNAKGQLSGGENKGIRLPRVKEREDLFQAGLPIRCAHHGEHLDWVRHAARTQIFTVVRCRRCMRDQTKRWVKRNYLHALAMWTKRRDANTEITEAFLQELLEKQGGRCALTGVLFEPSQKPSLDRIDSSLRYTKANVQLVLNDINRMKSNFALSLFFLRCRQVTEHALDSTAS